MLVLTAFLMAASAAITAMVAGALLRSPPTGLRIKNFRGVDTPAIGGVVIVAAYVAVESLLAFVALLRTASFEGGAGAIQQTFLSSEHLGIFALALGFFTLGAIDDLAEAGQARGFTGHLRALRRGRLTGGAIKALGGGAIAFIVSALWELELLPALIDGLVIALTANLINLLDLRPGRATKVFFVIWIPLSLASSDSPYLPVSGILAAAAAVWLLVDLSERGALGDSGANMLGATLGAGFVLSVSFEGRLIAAAVLMVLTVISERKSFTQLIERMLPLRWFDELGRRRPLV